jgi:hypothetical protein
MSTLFNDVQQETLHAALDRLIPADDFPGAWDAGCGDYIAGQLNGQLAHLLPVYQAGLDGLEAEALRQFQRNFSQLLPDQQDALLLRVETGDTHAEWQTAPREFFSALLNHTAEGYYADPGQGGNRERISWQMIGFNGK